MTPQIINLTVQALFALLPALAEALGTDSPFVDASDPDISAARLESVKARAKVAVDRLNAKQSIIRLEVDWST